ncbi:hypothetical protein F0562_035086 [Nyssa sinensis]|uniref:Uncharacterized protein n=1 Tax=Nyssa sinensis TaxID=561372 RepID=A0A5J5AAL3_9ASTE|nr:hypothetical protein F0562_035086 [Nyssa sinensis]
MSSQNFTSLVLPAILTFTSLRKLRLSDSFLSDEAIPSDLSCLCSLELLVLSRNNFVSLPGSISQLSRLEILYLVGCKKLEVLPELPSSLRKLNADDCPSLKSIVLPSTNQRLLDWGSFINCLELSQKQHGMALQHMFRESHRLCLSCIVVPGREIPQWFSDQNLGCSASTQLLQCCLRKNLLGFFVCFISEFVSEYTDVGEINILCKFKAHDGMEFLVSYYIGRLGKWGKKKINCQHVWLCFLGLSTIVHPSATFTCPTDWCQFEVLIDDDGGKLGIKKCGVSLVYNEGIDECMCETHPPWSSPTGHSVNLADYDQNWSPRYVYNDPPSSYIDETETWPWLWPWPRPWLRSYEYHYHEKCEFLADEPSSDEEW